MADGSTSPTGGRAGAPTANLMVGGRGLGTRTLRLYLPLSLLLILMLFPFYWMLITSIKPNRELYNARIMPMIVYQPTLKHYVDLLYRDQFPHLDVQHVPRGRRLDGRVARAGHDDRVSTGAHELPRRRRGGYRRGGHLPGPPAAALHPDVGHHQQARAGQYAPGGHAHVSDAPDPVLRVAPHGLLQECPARAGGGGAHRRGQPLPGDDTDRPSAMHPRPPVRGDLRLHAGPERVPLRAHLPHHERRADGAGGRDHGADPRRRLLLGAAHGGGAARLDSGGGDLFVLRRLLRRGPYLRRRRWIRRRARASWTGRST